MNQNQVMDLGRQAMEVAFMVSMPVLSVTLFVGLGVSVFQALTQIQEATLTFVPKIIAIGAVFLALGNWMLTTLVTFTASCLEHAARVTLPSGL
jgi:flagellar biosynthesis protein FliQ